MKLRELCGLIAIAFVFSSASVNADDDPHVLLIMADDLGWMDLGCQGNERLRTPNLDRLAESGARFKQAYAASPVCSPTRASLITGLAPARLKITQHGADSKRFWPEDRVIQPPISSHELSTDTMTFAEQLRGEGYRCGFFGKWHLGGSEEFWPLQHGFDVNLGGCGFGGPPTYFDPFRIPTLPNREKGEYLTDRLADETIRFMRQSYKSPMLICLWTYNPHYPFEAPADLIENYRGKEGRGLINPVYGAQIEATDRAVGRVLDELDRLEISDNTLVIFTSDNGGWSGATDNHPLRAGKGYLYEGGLRVPLLMRWPGVTTPGSEFEHPVVTMDLTATIREAVGISDRNESSNDGKSLKPMLDGEAWTERPLFFHYPHFAFHKANRPGSAIRQGKWKLIRNFDDDSVELYDLVSDLSESNNVAKQNPRLAEAMSARLAEWLNDTQAGIPTPR